MKNRTYRLVLLGVFAALMLSGCRKKEPVDLAGIHTSAAETMASETKQETDAAEAEKETEAATEAETSGAEETSAGVGAVAALSVRSKIATEKNGKVSVEYPILSNLRDSSVEEKVNKLLKETAMRVVTDNGLNPETDTVSVKCSVLSLDRSRAVLTYEGSMKAKDAAYPVNVFYTTTVDLSKGELIGLTSYADPASMASYILSDECVLYKPAASKDVLDELKASDPEALTATLEACDFTAANLDGFPQSFSYENQGDIFLIVPVSHALGDYAIVRYSPETK